MTAKQFLRQYEEANNKAIQRKREYERQMELIGSVSVKMDGMPHGSGISKPTEEDALRLAEKAEKLIRENEDILHKSAALLLDKEKINREEFEALFV